jgi:hypothetical protein
MSMDDDFVILIVCGMDNCVAFVDVVGNLVWMGAGANITSIVNSITNETHNYSYDDMDRITNWQYSNNSYSTKKEWRCQKI